MPETRRRIALIELPVSYIEYVFQDHMPGRPRRPPLQEFSILDIETALSHHSPEPAEGHYRFLVESHEFDPVSPGDNPPIYAPKVRTVLGDSGEPQ